MSPTDLPRFTARAFHGGGWSGRFDPSPFLGERWIGCVDTGDGRFLWGRFIGIDLPRHTGNFVPDDPDAADILHAGGSYPYLDGYWGERAELVLDATRTWRESDFHPRDAISTGSERFPGGWDHEHCSICWSKIDRGGKGAGFVSGANDSDWVCGECH